MGLAAAPLVLPEERFLARVFITPSLEFGDTAVTGTQDVVEYFCKQLRDNGGNLYCLIGEPGIGKSALLRQMRQALQDSQDMDRERRAGSRSSLSFLFLDVNKPPPNKANKETPSDYLHTWLDKTLGPHSSLGESYSRDRFAQFGARLEKMLTRLVEDGVDELVLLLDGLEEAEEELRTIVLTQLVPKFLNLTSRTKQCASVAMAYQGGIMNLFPLRVMRSNTIQVRLTGLPVVDASPRGQIERLLCFLPEVVEEEREAAFSERLQRPLNPLSAQEIERVVKQIATKQQHATIIDQLQYDLTSNPSVNAMLLGCLLLDPGPQPALRREHLEAALDAYLARRHLDAIAQKYVQKAYSDLGPAGAVSNPSPALPMALKAVLQDVFELLSTTKPPLPAPPGEPDPAPAASQPPPANPPQSFISEELAQREAWRAYYQTRTPRNVDNLLAALDKTVLATVGMRYELDATAFKLLSSMAARPPSPLVLPPGL